MDTGILITIIISLIFAILGTIISGKLVKKDKSKRLTLLLASIGTIAIHYSGIIYCAIGHAISPDKVMTVGQLITNNLNMVLPVYPCNAIMWACLILGLIKKEDSKAFRIFVDYVFLFGILAGLGGMIANGDYFNEAVPKDYLLYKSAIAHGVMIYNILLIPVFGYFKLETPKNLFRSFIGIAGMAIVGLYCSLVIYTLKGADYVTFVNAMFMFKTPIESVPLIRFHIVIPLFFILEFIVLTIVECFILPKEKRWFNQFKKNTK